MFKEVIGLWRNSFIHINYMGIKPLHMQTNFTVKHNIVYYYVTITNIVIFIYSAVERISNFKDEDTEFEDKATEVRSSLVLLHHGWFK